MSNICSQTTLTAEENKTEGSTSEELNAPEIEAKKTEAKFKERATPKITFRGDSSGGEVAFKKRKLNPEKKRNIRQAMK